MKKIYQLFLLVMLFSLVISGCSSNGTNNIKDDTSKEKAELTISAAASLQAALKDITADFETKHPNIKINYNFGASGALQQQISQGAPVDLFFSAAEDKFDLLTREGFIEKKNTIDLVGNDLVLVVPKGSNNGLKSFEDLTKAEKISIGTPESVPAGQYAKEILEKLNVWNAIEKNIVFAKDVRQVLTYVEMSNVDAGLVYKTDALTSPKVDVVATASKNNHTPIIYPVGVIKDSPHKEEAQLFYEYLQNKQSMDIFKKYGFNSLQ